MPLKQIKTTKYITAIGLTFIIFVLIIRGKLPIDIAFTFLPTIFFGGIILFIIGLIGLSVNLLGKKKTIIIVMILLVIIAIFIIGSVISTYLHYKSLDTGEIECSFFMYAKECMDGPCCCPIGLICD